MRKQTATFLLFFCLCAPVGAKAATLTYTYDNVGRLKTVTHSSGIVVDYDYDVMGNRLRKTVTIPPGLDTDGDGVPDLSDGCPFEPNDPVGDPCNHNDCSDQTPFDSLGDPCVHNDCADRTLEDVVGNVCNHDEDGDSVSDDLDACPLDPNDAVGNPCDHDDDGDGVVDTADACPLDPNDAIGDPCNHNDCTDLTLRDDMGEACNHNDCTDFSTRDANGDPCNHTDCPDFSSPDAVGDPCNHDEDGDLVADADDLFPTDETESADIDGDGTGNNADNDDDNDSIPDSLDPHPVEPNRSPTIEPLGDQEVEEDILLSFNVGALDPDGDPLIFGAENLPGGALFDEETGAFNWRPTFDQAGLYPNIRLTATDGYLEDSFTLTIAVAQTNRVPVLEPLDDRILTEGEEVFWTLVASDPDGDELQFSSPDLPEGAILDAESGEFLWRSTLTQAGGYAVTFVASDGLLNDREGIVLTVRNDEDGDGESDLFDDDDDGDGVDDSDDDFPSNQDEQFDTDDDGLGDHEDSDDDNDGITDKNDRHPLVANRPPLLQPIGTQVIQEGQTLEISLQGSDPDGDPLTFSLSEGPAGATLDADDGLFRWQVPLTGNKENDVLVKVSDGQATDEQQFLIVVIDEEAPPKVNDFLAIEKEDGVWLTWLLPLNDDVAGVILKRQTLAETDASMKQAMKELKTDVLFDGVADSYMDEAVQLGDWYSYQLYTYDEMGNLSEGIEASPPLFEYTAAGTGNKPVVSENEGGGETNPEEVDPNPEGEAGPPNVFRYIGGCSLVVTSK